VDACRLGNHLGTDSNHRFPVAKEMNPVREPEPSPRRHKSVSKR
jgi:hypothetical protein